ncbi:phosphate/phosphite/phosphonate ABC transporter substrate-binding protein [Roseateles sp. BYS96W]|uniref:Phosphate/phosphite/phosphonate ABC transporter substrate-binding protein n=1 Tax=Pelomonas nitida TaxID=3299027 RepID=A0ABW7GAM7_9BURK
MKAFALLLAAASFALPSLAQTEYRFSPVNQANLATAAAYWNPIVAYVSEKSGVRLSLKLGRTSVDTTAFVLAQEVEFAFTNHLFSPEREQMGWKVFGRRNTPPLHGQIVVAADSPIRNLAQLAGKDVGFPGPEAFIAYKTTYAQLLQQKVDVHPVFCGNMDGAFAQLVSGKVAAVGANSQLVEGYARREGRKFRVLWTSEPYHDLALMVSPKVPAADAQAVARAFIGMAHDPQGRQVLAAGAQLVGLPADAHFVASDGREYLPYRRFYEAAPAALR